MKFQVCCWLFFSALTSILLTLLLTQGNKPSTTSTAFTTISYDMTMFNSQHTETQTFNMSDVYTVYFRGYCKGNYGDATNVRYMDCEGFDTLAREFRRMDETWGPGVLDEMSKFFEKELPSTLKAIVGLDIFALTLIALQFLSSLITLYSGSPMLECFIPILLFPAIILTFWALSIIERTQNKASGIIYANIRLREGGIGISASFGAGLIVLSVCTFISALLIWVSWLFIPISEKKKNKDKKIEEVELGKL